VDAGSRQLVQTSLQDGTNQQTYHGYDLAVSITVPQQTITQEELNKRLQSL
jgi:YD repeat-containing protein